MDQSGLSNASLTRLARFLLAFSCVAALAALVATAAWWRAREQNVVNLDDLSASDRQRVFDQMHEALPGVFEPTWFQPDIAYTLRPDSEITVWDDTFHSNEIGYRTGPIRKRPNTYRILVVGDSWAYGMGIKEEESYPQVLARLVTEHAGLDKRVEAWTLALPGYNAISQTAAFDLWFGRLRPNLVVMAPSSNDNHSNAHLLPSGDLFVGTAPSDDWFGTHPLTYDLAHPIGSFEYLDRWRRVYERFRATEEKLDFYEIPSVFFYVALWSEPFVHKLMSEGGLQSSYAVVPGHLTLAEWGNPLPWGHGTPAANERYAHLLYRLLAQELDWPALPEAQLHSEIADVQLFTEPPPKSQWEGLVATDLAREERRVITERYVAGESARPQWPGPGTFETGVIGRSTTILVKPPSGTRTLTLEIERVKHVSGLYPITVTVSIPAPSQPSLVEAVLPWNEPPSVIIEVPIPPALQDGSVLDVKVESSATAALGHSRVPASLRIVRIEPAES